MILNLVLLSLVLGVPAAPTGAKLPTGRKVDSPPAGAAETFKFDEIRATCKISNHLNNDWSAHLLSGIKNRISDFSEIHPGRPISGPEARLGNKG